MIADLRAIGVGEFRESVGMNIDTNPTLNIRGNRINANEKGTSPVEEWI